MIKSDKGYVFTGLILFAAYLLQYLLELRWETLMLLQQQPWYKLASGTALLLVILFQWRLSRVRANPKVSAHKSIQQFKLHKWIGALSPLIYYLHAAFPGYAYLLILSILFFTNLLLGLLSQEVVPLKKQWYLQGWMVLHVSISCLIMALVLIHISMVVYFE